MTRDHWGRGGRLRWSPLPSSPGSSATWTAAAPSAPPPARAHGSTPVVMGQPPSSSGPSRPKAVARGRDRHDGEQGRRPRRSRPPPAHSSPLISRKVAANAGSLGPAANSSSAGLTAGKAGYAQDHGQGRLAGLTTGDGMPGWPRSRAPVGTSPGESRPRIRTPSRPSSAPWVWGPSDRSSARAAGVLQTRRRSGDRGRRRPGRGLRRGAGQWGGDRALRDSRDSVARGLGRWGVEIEGRARNGFGPGRVRPETARCELSSPKSTSARTM